MNNVFKNASVALFVLARLGVQGCQQSPQFPNKPANLSSPNNNNSGLAVECGLSISLDNENFSECLL
jgi:hypothetical protein